MRPTRIISRRSAGFTLLELVIVVLVLGIAGGLAVPLFNQAYTRTRLDGAAEAVAVALNFARLKSLSSQQLHRVVFDAAADRFVVEAYTFQKLDQIINPSKDTMKGEDIDDKSTWDTVPHPQETRRHTGEVKDYAVVFAQDPTYKGCDITYADFNGSETITFNAQGTPSAGGTVVLRLGGLQRTVTLTAVTGTVSMS